MAHHSFHHHHIKLKISALSKAKKSIFQYAQEAFHRFYSVTNIMAIYVFILIACLFSYEIVPFNEEFIAVMSIFFAFITIDKFASNVVKTVFQEEQHIMLLSLLKKSYDAFVLSVLQQKIEGQISATRRHEKLLAYTFVYHLLFLYTYVDFLIDDELVLEDTLDLDIDNIDEEL